MKKSTRPHRKGAPCRRGSVSIELCFVLGVMLVMLAVLTMLGRFFYSYNVIKAASNDAILHMTSLPPGHVMNNAKYMHASNTIRQMIVDASTSAGIEGVIYLEPDLLCEAGCNLGTLPGRMVLETGIWVEPMYFEYSLIGDAISRKTYVSAPYAH
jgi:hypothetical protein